MNLLSVVKFLSNKLMTCFLTVFPNYFCGFIPSVDTSFEKAHSLHTTRTVSECRSVSIIQSFNNSI